MKPAKITLLLFLGLLLSSKISFSQLLSTDNFVDVQVQTWIPCSGEFASGTVTLHYFQVYNKDGKIYKSHAQPQGGKLVGEQTGIVYNTVGVSQSKETIVQSEEAYTFKGIDNFHLVGTGKYGLKYKVHVNLSYTINANGDLTANIDQESITCD